MRGARRRIIALVIVSIASTASAQPSQRERDRALALFRESDAHYKRGDFERAATLLREAYSIHPEPLLLYNLARALEGLGDFEGAIQEYERYLTLATEIADRGAIERRIATLREQVARTSTRTSAPPVSTDNPTTPPVSDTRTTPASGEGGGGSATTVRLDPGPHEMRDKPQRLPWLIAGGGGVVLGGGVLLGYVSQARHDAAVDEPVQTEAQKLQDQAHTFATAANVAYVVGGVAIIGGVTWALLAKPQHRDAPRIGIGPSSISATWVFE